jgi:uncharacterized protein YhdP
MKTLFKTFAALFVLSTVLLGALAVWVTWYFDLNDYSRRIQQWVAQNTDYELAIDGRIEHYLLNGLVIQAKDVRLKKADQPLLDAESVSLRLHLPALLDGKLDFAEVSIHLRELNLVPNDRAQAAPGKNTALKDDATRPGRREFGPLQSARISDVELRIDSANYLDVKAKRHYTVKDIAAQWRNLTLVEAGAWVLDDPLAVLRGEPEGEIKAGSIVLGDRRFQDLEFAFQQQKDRLRFSRLAMRMSTPMRRSGDQRWRMAGSAQVRIQFAKRDKSPNKSSWALLEEVQLEAAEIDLAEWERLSDAGRTTLKKAHLSLSAVPLRKQGRYFSEWTQAERDKWFGGTPVSVRIKGESLQSSATHLTDFDLALGHTKGGLQVDVNKAKWRYTKASPAADVNNITANLSGHAQLSFKRQGKAGPTRFDVFAKSLLLTAKNVVLEHPAGRYGASDLEMKAQRLPIVFDAKPLNWSKVEDLRRIPQGAELSVRAKQLTHLQRTIESLELLLQREGDKLLLTSAKARLAATSVQAKGAIHAAKQPATWSLRLHSEKAALSHLLAFFNASIDAKGDLTVDIDIDAESLMVDKIVNTLNGRVLMSGRDIEVEGIALDPVLSNLENSQNVGLLDIGAYVLAGPAGALITKGSDYTALAASADTKGVNRFAQIHSELHIENGKIHTRDVAFATDRHRVAIKGSIDLPNNQALELEIATVDPQGCTKYMEKIAGALDKPVIGKAGVVAKGVIIAPVTSTLKRVADTLIQPSCEQPFYTGVVPSYGQEAARPVLGN